MADIPKEELIGRLNEIWSDLRETTDPAGYLYETMDKVCNLIEELEGTRIRIPDVPIIGKVYTDRNHKDSELFDVRDERHASIIRGLMYEKDANEVAERINKGERAWKPKR